MELQSLQDEKSSLIQSNQALNEQLHSLNQQSNNLIAENNRDKESLQRQLNTQVQKYKQLKNEKLFIERSHKLELIKCKEEREKYMKAARNTSTAVAVLCDSKPQLKLNRSFTTSFKKKGLHSVLVS